MLAYLKECVSPICSTKKLMLSGTKEPEVWQREADGLTLWYIISLALLDCCVVSSLENALSLS